MSVMNQVLLIISLVAAAGIIGYVIGTVLYVRRRP
jgi:hypothetical protein